MGAHAGVFFFDGRPAAHVCDVLRLGLQPFAPDGVSVHAEHGIAMAHGALHVWAGESHWPQPQRSAAGFVATWDGRLDNRDDLLLRLGQPLGADLSDVGLALTVFERWGIEGLQFLIGDWSLAIWDRDHRTLHLARDYMGVRPLYYCASDREMMWSSSLGELAQRAHRVDALSEEFVAGFMTLRFQADVTPYEGVRAVPAASCVSFSSEGQHTLQQFWHLDPGTVRYRDKRQYEERLRALWSEAVGTRLRVEGTVWAELSGGLDSSSVVCMADALIKHGRVRAVAVQPISHATLYSSEGDERRFIAEVETQIGTTSEILGVEDHCDCADDELDWVTPFATNGVSLAGLERIHKRGGRLVLSGRVGDAVMGCDPDNSLAVLDDLASGHLLSAFVNMRRWSRSCRKPFLEIGWKLVRRSTASGIASVLERRAAPDASQGEAMLSSRLKTLIQGHGHDDIVLARAVANARAANRDTAALVLAYAMGLRLNIPYTPPSIVYAYPFTHRPLVEYVLAIPGEQLSAPGQTRSLMRRAFDGLVPARILGRTSKGRYPPSAMRTARTLAASMPSVERLEVVRRGWLDGRRLEAAKRMLSDGGSGNAGAMRQAIRLEQWLASRNRRAPAVIPQRKEVNSHEVFNA
jgi:asparagine synthase (glutamine-hydrolysing)